MIRIDYMKTFFVLYKCNFKEERKKLVTVVGEGGSEL